MVALPSLQLLDWCHLSLMWPMELKSGSIRNSYVIYQYTRSPFLSWVLQLMPCYQPIASWVKQLVPRCQLRLHSNFQRLLLLHLVQTHKVNLSLGIILNGLIIFQTVMNWLCDNGGLRNGYLNYAFVFLPFFLIRGRKCSVVAWMNM